MLTNSNDLYLVSPHGSFFFLFIQIQYMRIYFLNLKELLKTFKCTFDSRSSCALGSAGSDGSTFLAVGEQTGYRTSERHLGKEDEKYC